MPWSEPEFAGSWVVTWPVVETQVVCAREAAGRRTALKATSAQRNNFMGTWLLKERSEKRPRRVPLRTVRSDPISDSLVEESIWNWTCPFYHPNKRKVGGTRRPRPRQKQRLWTLSLIHISEP